MSDTKQIVAALAKAMSEVKRLGKDNQNTDQKYGFASIDDFLAMTGPIMASNGLVVLMNEDSVQEFERQGKYAMTFWLRIVFSIQVLHSSGESLPATRRSVEVIRTGPQAFGAAQSYVEKQFLRGLLQIPTGDKDEADETPHSADMPMGATREGLDNAWRDSVMDSLPANASPRQKAEAFANFICADFKDKGLRALNNRWERYKETIMQITSRHADLGEAIVDAFETRKNELTEGRMAAE